MAAAADDDVAPPDLKFPCLVFDVAFHPTQDVIATGLVSGSLQLCVVAPRAPRRRGRRVAALPRDRGRTSARAVAHRTAQSCGQPHAHIPPPRSSALRCSFQYAPGVCKKVVAVPLHTEGIRSVAFTAAGDREFCGRLE
jgi:hypothetical protein